MWWAGPQGERGYHAHRLPAAVHRGRTPPHHPPPRSRAVPARQAGALGAQAQGGVAEPAVERAAPAQSPRADDLGRQTGRRTSVRRVTMNGVARLGVGIELVGRRHEVSVLTAALDRAAAGKPTGILMSGDAGVGKSRLVAEAVEHAAKDGFAVLVGRCLDTAESALPYLPFTEIVGALAATHTELVEEHAALRHLLPGGFAEGTQRGENRDLGQLRVFDA